MAHPVPPELILTPTQRNKKVVIPFFQDPIGATAVWLQCSRRIDFNYKITKIEVHCREDTADNLEVEIFTGSGWQAAAAVAAIGTNILSRLTTTPYIVGEGETVIIHCNFIPEFRDQYIKVHWNNTNAYALSGMVLVTIEAITQEDLEAPPEAGEFEVVTKTPEEYYNELRNKSVANLEMITGLLEGTDLWLKPSLEKWESQVDTQKEGIYPEYMRFMNLPAFTPTTMPLEDRYKTSKAWLDGVLELSHKFYFDSAVMKAATSAFGFNIETWQEWFENHFGLQEKTRRLLDIAFDKGMMKPVEHYWNKMYQPEYPDVNQLINMVVKEKLPVKDFKEIMTYQGFSDFWSGKIWDAHFNAPDFDEIKQAYWRGKITEDEIEHYLKLVDLDPFYNEKVWTELLYEIPPYQDLINMRVKEVIGAEEFAKSIQAHGYYGHWAGKLWDAHFTPPQFMDFLLAMRRKQTTSIPIAEGEPTIHTFGEDAARDIEKIKELSILADYDPRYWDFFRQRIYDDPTPRQARWGYEAGALTEDQVFDITKRHGFKDEDAKWFTDFTLKFQERPFITRYLNALMSAYLVDVIDADELTKRVTEIPRREAIADWIIKIADVRKEIADAKPVIEKEKLLSLSDLKRLYSLGHMGVGDFEYRLSARGYSDEDVVWLRKSLKPPEIAKERLLSLSEMKKMFALELMGEDEFRTKLLVMGYELLDVDLLINLVHKIKEATESGGQKRALSVSEMMSAFKWWQISEEELRTNLMLRGLTLAEANLLINTKKEHWKTKEDWTEIKPVPEEV